MTTEKHIPTVFDIAREAGVSRGTVDRVLHRRGRFSDQTAAKVLLAVEKLGYRANPNAAFLASRKTRTIACLLPSFRDGEYWDLIHRGLLSGIPKNGKIDLQFFLYDQTDPDSFIGESEHLLESSPAAVVMNVVFREAVTEFSKKLGASGIPYAFLDNKIDGLGNLFYVGIEPYRSGELGAFLLTHAGPAEEIGLIRILRDKGKRGDPNEPRRNGFLDFLKAHGTQKVHTVFIDPSAPESIMDSLESFASAHPHLRHYASTNSRIHLAAPFFKRHPEITSVGFDDLEKNLQALKDGSVDFLVTHHIQDQARLCVSIFTDYLIGGSRPAKRNYFIHLDILHRLNSDDYTD